MPPNAQSMTPGLASFIKQVRNSDGDSSVERLISLLKRRQIRNSRPVAIATTHLLLWVVISYRWTHIDQLITHIKSVGRRLCSAQPREMVIGNIVRRVLSLIRGEVDENRKEGTTTNYSESGSEDRSPEDRHPLQRPGLSATMSMYSPLKHAGAAATGDNFHDSESEDLESSTELKPRPAQAQRPPLITSHTSGYAAGTGAPMITSMFSLLSTPETYSPSDTPPHSSQRHTSGSALTAQHLARLTPQADLECKHLKGEIINGIEEIMDELDQVDEQIAAYAIEHIHSKEVVLTATSSVTVQKFLLKAGHKRNFTVIHAENFPNDHDATHAIISGNANSEAEDDLPVEVFQKTLTAAGITVIVIPDSAVYALMSRVNKVILGTHAVLANGGLVAAAGARMIAKAAQEHSTPVVVVTGVYKLSPVYPFDFESLIEMGDAGKVVGYENGDLVEKVDVVNPLYDYVPAELIDLYITNLGGHAPSFLYRLIQDHYRVEDISL